MSNTSGSRGIGGWALILFSLILIGLGLPIFLGGIQLASLGGSYYYVLAGLGLIVSGVLLVLDRASGAWLYGLVFLGTLIWAFWEVGLDGWALVPRLVGPAVLGVILLLFIPVIKRRSARPA